MNTNNHNYTSSNPASETVTGLVLDIGKQWLGQMYESEMKLQRNLLGQEILTRFEFRHNVSVHLTGGRGEWSSNPELHNFKT
jgi:hypothetical protein